MSLAGLEPAPLAPTEPCPKLQGSGQPRGARSDAAARSCLFLVLLPLVLRIVAIQATYSLEDFEAQKLSNLNSVLLIVASSLLMVFGAPAMFKVFKPIRASFTQLDGERATSYKVTKSQSYKGTKLQSYSHKVTSQTRATSSCRC